MLNSNSKLLWRDTRKWKWHCLKEAVISSVDLELEYNLVKKKCVKLWIFWRVKKGAMSQHLFGSFQNKDLNGQESSFWLKVQVLRQNSLYPAYWLHFLRQLFHTSRSQLSSCENKDQTCLIELFWVLNHIIHSKLLVQSPHYKECVCVFSC